MQRDRSKLFLILSGILFTVVYPLWYSMLYPRSALAGIIAAIVPAAVPTANKIGNSSKFQLGSGTAGTGDCAAFDSNNNVVSAGVGVCNGTGAAVPFSGITGATNSTAAMVVGTGAALTRSGSGSIDASLLNSTTAYQTFQNGGSGLTQRATVNFTGAGVSCADTGGITVCTVAGASAGALVLVEQHTASTSATLPFTTCFSATYDDYMIDLVQMVPATADVGITMQVSTGGGIFDTGNHYNWQAFAMVTGGSGANGSGSDTKIWLTVAQSNQSSSAFSGSYHFFGPGSALQKQITGTGLGMDTSASRIIGYSAGGQFTQTTAVDGFRILASSGDLTSGTVRCYGVAK